MHNNCPLEINKFFEHEINKFFDTNHMHAVYAQLLGTMVGTNAGHSYT